LTLVWISGTSIVGRPRRAEEALAKVGQALRAGSTSLLLAYGKDNWNASPAGASMRSGRALARTLRSSKEVQPLWELL